MSLTVTQLKERRKVVGDQIKALANQADAEDRDMTSEERSEWDRANVEFELLTEEIDGTEAEFERQGGVKPGNEDRVARYSKYKLVDGELVRKDRSQHDTTRDALALQGWMRSAERLALTPRQERAMQASGVRPWSRGLDFALPIRPAMEKRALSAVTGSAGGYTVPQGFVPALERAMKWYAASRQVADVMRTDGGNDFPWPTSDDTGNVGERIAENTQVAEQDVAFATVTLKAYKYSSKLVRVPHELLEDNAVNLAEKLGEMLGERIGRIQATDFTTGTGSGQPQGIVTASTAGKTAASATTFTPDELLDLIHSVDPAYRSDPSFALMMSDVVYAFIRKVKDSQNRYLFTDPVDGGPPRFFGVPIIINTAMSSAFTTGQKLVLAGAFSKFKIRDVNVVRLNKLVERYAELDQVGFIAFLRSDSRLLDAGTNPVKHLKLA